MFHEHESFTPPEDKNVKIWRYMDITKFLALIESEALYFPRADKLGDPFEGSYTIRALADRNDGGKNYSKWYENLKTTVLINCWHMNEHESEAMWKLYLKSNEGIAVQSTYNRLVESLSRDKNYHTQIGVVKYLDYEKDTFTIGNTFNAFLIKRKSFEHERELRAITDLSLWNPGTKGADEKVDHGKAIPIHIATLIERVYLAPYCETWVLNLLEEIMNRYSLNLRITQSALTSKPLY